MLIGFFFHLKESGLPVSITEFLALQQAMKMGVVGWTVDEFYQLSRTCLVKDETLYDRFDRAFGSYMEGVEAVTEETFKDIPEEWLAKQAEKFLTEEDKAKIEALGGLDKLMETFRERMKEQNERHQGGNKWVGTAGTSPFGAYGYNPEGIRIGQDRSRNRKAVKVWDKREFQNLDKDVELGTRNIKVALRKLRQFAREGAAEELDLDDTIRSTARNAGYLDIKMVPERHNAVKVLIMFDIGGSMDDHIRSCEELFSAAHSEFKHLEFFYFHNYIYEFVWKDNGRRHNDRLSTLELMHKYGADYKVIFVGDATMSPYEIAYPGGSVEHWNKEPGSVWMERMKAVYKNLVWLNPQPEEYWPTIPSCQMAKELVDDRMFPLTVSGLDKAIKALRKKV